MSDTLAPIALFAYNRPRHLAQAVAALLRDPLAASSDLYVFCDGPKTAAAAAAVAEVRSFVRSITGFHSISIVDRERNFGLANSIIAGVTDLCDRFGRTIVIEDDLVVAPCFLRFMNEGLTRYENDERAMQVAGYMFPIPRRFRRRAFFLPFASSWGWATWARAWRHFDPLMTGYEALRQSPQLRHQFDLHGAYPYFETLERQRRDEIDSWAIRWYLSCFQLGGLTLYPGTTLAKNNGFDGSGTHCGTDDSYTLGGNDLPERTHTFSFPRTVATDSVALAHTKQALRDVQRSSGILRRLRRLWR